jgi:membrane dipeptidase
MDRRTALRALSSAAIASIGAPAILRGRYRLFAESTAEYSARTIALMRESTVIDMLCQFAFDDFRRADGALGQRWLRDPRTFTAADFAVFRDSGVSVLALGSGPGDYEQAMRFYAQWNGFIASNSQWFTRIDDAKDLQSVKASGKIGVMLTAQISDHFRTPDDVSTFYSLGQRASQLTYNMQSRIGAGFLENRDGGLSAFGHDIVARMEQVGMVVDLSHCADQTTLDALAAATRPPIFSHASSRAALPACLRCKTDEALKQLAAKGGVVGVPMIRFMIRPAPPVTVQHVVDHVEHLFKLIGPDHVGIGSDLDMLGLSNGMPATGQPDISRQPNFARYGAYMTADGMAHVDGLNHPKRVFDLTEAMVQRKHSDENIRLLLGGSFARVLSAVWK